MAKKKEKKDKDSVVDAAFERIKREVEFKSLDTPEVQAAVKTVLSEMYDEEPE